MSFVPVDFRQPDPAIGQADSSLALHFAPIALSIQTPQPGQRTNAPACGDRLDSRDFADNVEIGHARMLPPRGRPEALAGDDNRALRLARRHSMADR
jgi:hypothetical protein